MTLAFRKVRAARIADPFFHEHVLVWGLMGLPFLTLAATKLAHGALDHRYVLPAVLAIPLGAGYILPRLNRSVVLLFAILVLSVLANQETRFWASQRGHLGQIASPAVPVERLVDSAAYPNLPVVVSDDIDFLQLVYYASPELAGRLAAVVDPTQAVAHIGYDNMDKSLLALRSCNALPVYEFRVFASEHASFLLYSSGGFWDWWPRALAGDGYSLQVVAAAEGTKVYLVIRDQTHLDGLNVAGAGASLKQAMMRRGEKIYSAHAGIRCHSNFE